jgi:hypothetical protein
MTIDKARLQRAVSSRTATPREDGTWLVTGGAEPHIATAATCDCTDHRIRGGECMHILLVKLHTGDSEVIAALAHVIPQQQRKSRRVSYLEVEAPDGASTFEPLIPLGALEQWRAEINRGDRGQLRDKPSTWIMDDLFMAAAYEATALEDERRGDHTSARDAMNRAIEILAGSNNRGSVAA